jgi:hypothetical protein
MRVIIVSIILIFTSNTLFSQNTTFRLNWVDKRNVAIDENKALIVPAFQSENFSFNYFSNQILYANTISGLEEGEYQLTNISYEIISRNLLSKLKNIPTSIGYEIAQSRARDNLFTTITFNPIINENGQYKKVVSYTLERIGPKSVSSFTTKNASTPQNSILAEGKIYKFYVEETGVHRVTFSFLSQLGLDLSDVNSNDIKVYSHGGQMMPLRNGQNQFFDPPQLPIQVFDGGDGKFNSGDFFLLYAESTTGWNEENQTHIHAYANRAFYYITLNDEAPVRIPNAQNLSATPNVVVNDFDDFRFYEKDETSMSLTGRRWFGDRFDIQTEREYNFQFNNLITSEPLFYEMEFGAISVINTTFNIDINANNVTNVTVGANGDNLPSNGNGVSSQTNVSSNDITVKLTYDKQGNPAARGFLDYIRLRAKCQLRGIGDQFVFQNLSIPFSTAVVQYTIENASNISQVWKIDALNEISAYQNETSENTFSFSTEHNPQTKFIAIDPSDYYSPRFFTSDRIVENQDLKGTIFLNAQGEFQDVDYIIITNNEYLSHANRLAEYRRTNNNLNVKVVDVQTIYDEFSTGKQDIVAIRNFMKYVYDNASSPANRIKYLGIIGDSSVDYKDRLPGNNNIVPTFQSLNSFATTASSFMSDDFFVIMDDNEGTMAASDKMDFAVGRILVETQTQAREAIDKIIEYEKRDSFDTWRNNFILVSDDVDLDWEHNSIQVNLDNLGDEISSNKPNINVKKIHSDAFQQQTSAGGDRYPRVNAEIQNQVEVGATVLNYFGHGGEDGLAQERIVTQTDVESWQNPNRYNIFLTVTCEFTRFDNPLRLTAGEVCYRNPNGGPVGMITTTRAISVGDGVTVNRELAPFLFDYNNEKLSVGEAVRRTKNLISSNGRRIIYYLGDPALRIPFPDPNVRLTRVNNIPVTQFQDTLKALSKNKFSGEIVDANGNRIENYNGVVTTTIFDKRIQRSTLGNDGTRNALGELLILDFTTLGETLFRGQATVKNGSFEVEFVLPKDTRIPIGNGRVSFYSVRDGELEDQSGFSNDILIGDINENADTDNEGPIIQLYMNDESFIDGEITNDSPFLLAKLQDDNGINTAGGIGHDIVAILDGDEANPIILNEYYEADVDDFSSGEVLYKLRNLEDGLHTISFKGWDTFNNSSTAEITFRVANEDGLDITRVLNYPNPFVSYTEFWFHHNQPQVPLNVQVQVYTVTGKVVWTHNQTITTDSFLAREITWDGRDDFGNQIGKGVYVYKLTVESPTINKKVEKIEKLVKL